MGDDLKDVGDKSDKSDRRKDAVCAVGEGVDESVGLIEQVLDERVCKSVEYEVSSGSE